MDIEQSTLIWIARLAFFAVALVITIYIWFFMRKERVFSSYISPKYQPPDYLNLPEKNIVLTIMAKPGSSFNGKELFKSMHELNLHFSKNNIFEYFVPNSKDIAFSIINAQESKKFPSKPNDMIATKGIIAVMQLPIGDGDNQIKHFHLFISVLNELRIKLNGDLCDLTYNLIKNKKLYEIQKSIENFEKKYTTIIQDDYKRRNI